MNWLKNLFLKKNDTPKVFSSHFDDVCADGKQVQKVLCNPKKYYQLSFDEQVQKVYSSPLVKLGILDENWKIPSLSVNSLAKFSIKDGQEKEEYVNPFPLSSSRDVLFEEQIWGIKVCDYFLYDINDFSLATAMQRALLLPNAEVVHLKNIYYKKNGERRIESTSEPLCFVLHPKPAQFVKRIRVQRAKDLFPECIEEINNLGWYIDYLDVSDDTYHLLVTERSKLFHVFTIDKFNDKLKTQNVCFKNIFAEIANAVKSGNLSPVDTENFSRYTYTVDIGNKIDASVSTYNFKVGFCDLSFEQAQQIAKDKKGLRLAYIDGKDRFMYHCKGVFLNNQENCLVLPMEIYASWGADFTEYELKKIFAK